MLKNFKLDLYVRNLMIDRNCNCVLNVRANTIITPKKLMCLDSMLLLKLIVNMEICVYLCTDL